MKTPVVCSVLLLIASSLSYAAAYGGGIDCPPHPPHCSINPIELLDGTIVTTDATVESEVTATTSAQVFVQLGARAKVVVTLSINSTTTGNRTVDATVVVNETAGMQLTEPGTGSATITPAKPAVLEFAFDTDEDLVEGDVIFIPVLVRAESLTSSGYAPFVVGSGGTELPEETDVLLPVITGILGLGTGSGLTYFLTRRT